MPFSRTAAPSPFNWKAGPPDGVSLRSPVFGQARFDPNAFRRLVFQPLDTAAGNGTNSG